MGDISLSDHLVIFYLSCDSEKVLNLTRYRYLRWFTSANLHPIQFAPQKYYNDIATTKQYDNNTTATMVGVVLFCCCCDDLVTLTFELLTSK